MRIERDRGVVTATNDDPPLNRMTFEYLDEVEQLVEEVATNPADRVLVFTAEGDDNFSVGMDLKQLRSSAGERASMGRWRGGSSLGTRMRGSSTTDSTARATTSTSRRGTR